MRVEGDLNEAIITKGGNSIIDDSVDIRNLFSSSETEAEGLGAGEISFLKSLIQVLIIKITQIIIVDIR